LAVSPGHAVYTLAPKLDHHVLEPILILLLFLMPPLGNGGRLSPGSRIMGALCFPVTLLLWRGAPLFWVDAFAVMLIHAAVEYRRGNRAPVNDYPWMFFGGAVCLGALCFLDPWGMAGGVSSLVFSWFHVNLLLAFAVLLAILGRSGSVKGFAIRAGGSVLVMLSLLLFTQRKEVGSSVLDAVSFVFGNEDAWLGPIGEQALIFKQGVFSGPLYFLTVIWFLAPLAVVVAAREWRRGGMRDVGHLRMLVWVIGVIPLVRNRYTVDVAVIVALFGGYLLAYCWKTWVSSYGRALSVLALIILLAPSHDGYKDLITYDLSEAERFEEFGENGIFQWLRDHTPATSFYLNPRRPPEYGVLAPWYMGSKITVLSRRASVSTGFGWEAHGLYESSGFLATPVPERAYDIVLENKVRYVIVKQDGHFDDYFRVAQQGVSKGTLPPDLLAGYDPFASIYTRLLFFDGSAYEAEGRVIPSLGRFRLLYETPSISGRLDAYKIFEFVPGAVITGRCTSAVPVSVELSLRTSIGREFVYSAMEQPDEAGRFHVVVPYATASLQGATQALDTYRLSCGDNVIARIRVTESDVATGAIIPSRRE
jgi:dolichyl-diphosphooligosaccharide--protein glycosyltransferase